MSNNISEFEREKPTVTFKKIQELNKLVQKLRTEEDARHFALVNQLANIDSMIAGLKDSFLKGE